MGPRTAVEAIRVGERRAELLWSIASFRRALERVTSAPNADDALRHLLQAAEDFVAAGLYRSAVYRRDLLAVIERLRPTESRPNWTRLVLRLVLNQLINRLELRDGSDRGLFYVRMAILDDLRLAPSVAPTGVQRLATSWLCLGLARNESKGTARWRTDGHLVRAALRDLHLDAHASHIEKVLELPPAPSRVTSRAPMVGTVDAARLVAVGIESALLPPQVRPSLRHLRAFLLTPHRVRLEIKGDRLVVAPV